jgi:hypothetical protein
MKSSIHLLTALALFVTPQRTAAQVPFALSTSLTNGTLVRSVTTADVNNDGKPDLISARANPSFVYVWTNAGNGLFVSNGYAAGTSHPNQVIAADVNNDGWVDLITAGTGNALIVLTNDRNGGFLLAGTLPTGANTQPRSVAAADLFGRGVLDLISANSLNATVTVWTNSGGGIFASNTSFSVGSAGFEVPQSVTTADVNGDGKPDIICGGNNFSPYLFLWTNNGAGSFASAPVPFITSGITCVVAADVNGDGKPDLVLTTSQVTVLTNNGSGAFVLSGNYPVGLTPDAVVAADVNGDTWVDLITCNQGDNTLTVLTNNGNGGFGTNTTLNVGNGPQSLTAADLNSDGRLDLISANSNDGTLTLLTNAATFLPRLACRRSGNNFTVSWPAVWANWTLQQNTNLAAGGWNSFSGPISNDGTTKTVTNSSAMENLFFRLSRAVVP